VQLDATTDESFVQSYIRKNGEDDSALIVRFFVKPKLLGLRSKQAGRPVYEDREYVEIKVKGQDKQVAVHPVKEEHKQRFPIAYMQFQSKKPAPVIGTPVEMLPNLGPSLAMHLKSINIRTIEDLSNISDENTLQAIGMGARELVNRAKQWVSGSSTKEAGLQEQIEKAKAENEQLREMVAQMQSRMEALEKPPEVRVKRKYTRRKGVTP